MTEKLAKFILKALIAHAAAKIVKKQLNKF